MIPNRLVEILLSRNIAVLSRGATKSSLLKCGATDVYVENWFDFNHTTNYLCTTENWCIGNNYVKQPENRNVCYWGHMMRNTSGYSATLLITIEGCLKANEEERERPRRTRVDGLRDWTGTKRYGQIGPT